MVTEEIEELQGTDRLRDWIQGLSEIHFLGLAILLAVVAASATMLYWEVWNARDADKPGVVDAISMPARDPEPEHTPDPEPEPEGGDAA